MKKFYFLILFAIGVAGMCMAQQDTVKAVTINNWDGSYKSPNMPLYIGVEEIKILNLTLEPADADESTIHLGIEMEEGDEEEGPFGFWGMEIYSSWEATRTLYIYNHDRSQILAQTQITSYATAGEMDGDNTVMWSIETDWETGELQLVLMHDPSAEEPAVLEDRDKDTKYPWDEMGHTINKLQVDGHYSYIGEGVFDQLYNLYNIQFTGDEQSVESIHYLAFSTEIHPWRFAFGNPQNGPVIPPTVIFEDQNEEKGLEYWQHMFSEETVLYVPDSLIQYLGREVRSVELYRNHAVWGNAFNRIDDHTVSVAEVTDNTTILTWMPQERATAYILNIHKEGCDNCDTTITIEADGYQGLLYEEDEPTVLPALRARAPKSDDGGGGMTITILIGGGGFHTQDVTATISDMAPEANYNYTRSVMIDGAISEDFTKSGSVETLPAGTAEAIDDVRTSGEKRAYDLLGRPMGSSLEDLPEGLYIWDDGTKRTTIMIRK